MSPRGALAPALAAAAMPYGYTISVWGSGALLTRTHGLPQTWEIGAFAAGAVLAFALLGLFARGAVGPEHAADRLVAGALHWLAAGAAIGSAALVSRLPGWEAWPLASFAATAAFFLCASAQLALAAARH